MEWLDKEHPGWVAKLDMWKLNLASSCNCIIGQVCGGFWTAKDSLGFKSELEYHNWAQEHGFAIPRPLDARYYYTLQDEWCEALAERDAINAEFNKVISEVPVHAEV